ncbi:kynurenine formamidase [Ambystoma mexicanum]|uniref:kynurenine formamidase n=1 Tax=Ambystoma mexicanum TaxID=8296 RepID=UPI0037E704BC
MAHWKDMETGVLEKQYSPSCWSLRMSSEEVIDAHVKVTASGTQKSKGLVQTLLNVPYGTKEGENLDVYLPSNPCGALPLLVYIHGGYWQFFSKEESGFMAAPLVAKGIAVAAIDYDIAPKGHMDLMVSQVRRSIAFIVQQYSHFSGLYLCGHSAGAHLAAMALSTDWSEYGVRPDIKGVFLVSGIYDLLPITRTYVNQELQMTEEVALRNSPLQHLQEVKPANENCRIAVVVAENDSPEFHRQSREYFQGLQKLGLNISFAMVDNTDHFDVIEGLCEENNVLTKMLLDLILEA